MLRVNIFQYYGFGSIRNIRWIKGKDTNSTQSPEEILRIIGIAQESLEELLNQQIVALITVRPAAEDLLGKINNIIETFDPKKRNTPTSLQIQRLKSSLAKFEAILEAELTRADTYVVSQKGIYSTPDLVEAAENVLPAKLRAALPDLALYDIQQCGRCLAFEIPTGAGFHILRAAEAVILKYYETLTGEPWPFKKRDWGEYIKQLKLIDAPEKVTEALDQVRLSYRNPLMHPEDKLDFDEALGLFGMVQGLLSMILQEIVSAAPAQ